MTFRGGAEPSLNRYVMVGSWAASAQRLSAPSQQTLNADTVYTLLVDPTAPIGTFEQFTRDIPIR